MEKIEEAFLEPCAYCHHRKYGEFIISLDFPYGGPVCTRCLNFPLVKLYGRVKGRSYGSQEEIRKVFYTYRVRGRPNEEN